MTNNGRSLSFEDIKKYRNLKIKDIILHIIPLSLSNSVGDLRAAAGVIKQFVPCLTYPSLTHLSVQINLEKCNDILFIEYGEYFTEKSKLIKESSILKSSGCSKQPRKLQDKFFYYYINVDGARITVITENNMINYYNSNKYWFAKTVTELNGLNIPELVTGLVASQHYNIDDLESKTNFRDAFNNFKRVECDIKNKVYLSKFIDHFKGEKWTAGKYNLVFHNCQDFACEIIRFLQATRRNETDRLRIVEKVKLPNCVVNAFISTEGLTAVNVLGRIPIFGYFHDLYKGFELNLNGF